MKMIIESEVKRAEALVERYIGLPPETIDLFNFNADALRKAPADFARAIRGLGSNGTESALKPYQYCSVDFSLAWESS